MKMTIKKKKKTNKNKVEIAPLRAQVEITAVPTNMLVKPKMIKLKIENKEEMI